MARVKAAKVATKSLADLGLENYTIATIHRSELKNAEYNPRTMGADEKRKLRAGLKKHGLVAPITWNRTTGNIVGGHQRIEQLDALAGTHDYELQVAAIETDEVHEKEVNVLLNNYEAQGSWDLGKLGKIFDDVSLDIEGMGFDKVDVFRMFGNATPQYDDPRFAELAEELAKLKATFKKSDASRTDSEFYLVVVFRSGKHRDAFIAKHGLRDDRYQSGEAFDEIMSGPPRKGEPAP